MVKNIKSQKIGIFGGTFDPINLGHIKTAHVALKYLELNKVLFIPAGDPYLKSNHIEITNSQMRLEMVRLETIVLASVLVAVTNRSPATESFDAGVVVPMPTLPEEVIRIFSVVPFANLMLSILLSEFPKTTSLPA